MATTTTSHGPVPVPVGKTPIYPIVLPPELRDRIVKPVKGAGGWQTLMTDIQGHTDGPGLTAEIPDALLRRLIPYAVEFGSGGYQGVIRWILCLVLAQHMPQLIGEGTTLMSLAKAKAKAVSLKPSKAIKATAAAVAP
jgi:hypothetical protein